MRCRLRSRPASSRPTSRLRFAPPSASTRHAVLINDHTAFRTDWMPFAGRRQSGYGVGGIPASMEAMSQEKMIVVRHEV